MSVGKYLDNFSVLWGQPKNTNGANAELNQVSKTSGSWVHLPSDIMTMDKWLYKSINQMANELKIQMF